MTVFRIQPQMPPGSYRTFQILAPLNTHWRPGTCSEAQCNSYVNGWKTLVDESTKLGQAQASYIRHEAKRLFTEGKDESGITVFTFEAGQQGFGSEHKHQIRTPQPDRFRVRGGDWRGNPSGEVREFKQARDWIDEFGEHQERLKTIFDRG